MHTITEYTTKIRIVLQKHKRNTSKGTTACAAIAVVTSNPSWRELSRLKLRDDLISQGLNSQEG
ncbi:hypothetical protein BDV18DRAFT_56996 [Aspergillus unguis]